MLKVVQDLEDQAQICEPDALTPGNDVSRIFEVVCFISEQGNEQIQRLIKQNKSLAKRNKNDKNRLEETKDAQAALEVDRDRYQSCVRANEDLSRENEDLKAQIQDYKLHADDMDEQARQDARKLSQAAYEKENAEFDRLNMEH